VDHLKTGHLSLVLEWFTSLDKMVVKPFCFYHLKTKQIVWFSNGKNKMATKPFENQTSENRTIQ
jgi:hypothetical protein